MDNTKHKIMIVDDTLTSLIHAKNLLQDHFKVYAFQSAALLFEHIKHVLPDLILLDVLMPEMDGFEALSKLKSDIRYRDIPVIFLTSKSDEESERMGFSLGAADYITKPFSAPVLQNRISNQILYRHVQSVVKNYSGNIEDLVEEFTKANERAKILLDKTPLCARLWDRDFNLMDCNEAAIKLFGFNDKQDFLKRHYELYPERQPDGQDSKEKAKKLVEKAFTEGSCEFEWTYRMLDGTLMPAEVTLIRVEYKDGYVVAGYTRDLRAQKAIIEEMRRAEIAEESNKAKSRFLASMNHEIRTPMNVIVGLTELLLEEEALPEHVIDKLKKIDTAGETLMGLINDVLDISKIESGKFTLAPERYDVASLLSSIISINVIRTEDKPVSFRLNVDSDMYAQLYGDDLRVKQILNNLLSNAFKYTHSGTVTLSVDCARTGENEVMLSVAVNDTGIGLRTEDLDTIFTAYNQVDAKANRYIEGTGLGLSITKHLTELMGGEITVESEYGKGTSFSLKLRQGLISDERIGDDKAQELRAFRFERRKAVRKLVRPDLSYVKVLVVDDFPTNLDVAKGLLNKYKISVDCVASGQEAIDRVKHGEPAYDIIFMDHMMPGMDGIESTRLIRATDSDYARSVIIIALTANAISSNERMFLENGFNAFLPKPINVAKVDAILRQWIIKETHVTLPPAAQAHASGAAPFAPLHPQPFSSAQFSVSHFAGVDIPGIDASIGLSLYGDDIDMFVDILRSFVENMPDEVKKLCNVTEQRLKDYAIDAHTIKGSAASIGAENLANRAKLMETMAKSGDYPGVFAGNAGFIGEINTLVTDIEAFLSAAGNVS